MNPEVSQSACLNPLTSFRQQFATSIRREQRLAEITKLRMRNIMSMCPKQEQEYSSINHRQFQINQVPALFQCIISGEEEKVIVGLVGIRKLLAEATSMSLIDQVFDAGVFDAILGMAKDPRCLKRQMEANWILANMAAGNMRHIDIMVDRGIFQHITDQLKKEVPVIDEEIIFLVGNIAGTGEYYVGQFVKNGTVKQIINIYNRVQNTQVKKSALWVICNVLRQDKFLPEDIIELTVPLLIKELGQDHGQEDTVIMNDIFWALWKISIKSRLACLIILKQQALFKMIELVAKVPSVILCCIRIIGSVCLKLDTENNSLVGTGIVNFLQKNLHHQEPMIRKETSWVLSNFSAGTKLQSQQMFNNAQIMQTLQYMFFNDRMQIRINVGWVLSNFVAKIQAQFIYPMFERILKGFMELCGQEKNINALQIGLKGIQNYLVITGLLNLNDTIQFKTNFNGIEKIIYQLQSHHSMRITQMVQSLIENFFQSTSGDDQDMFI